MVLNFCIELRNTMTLREMYHTVRKFSAARSIDISTLLENCLLSIRCMVSVFIEERQKYCELMKCLAIPSEPLGGNHTPAFAKAAATMEAHNATITVSKGLALTALRVLDDARFFGQVKAAFDTQNQMARM